MFRKKFKRENLFKLKQFCRKEFEQFFDMDKQACI